MTGITTIPRTHNGEGLAYISPQEAQMLRQQGGGVAPDGGQLQGPGGIPSFQCFVAGSKVTMDDHSLKNIEDVEVGDKLRRLDGKNNTVMKVQENIFTDGRKLGSINNGPYFFTEDHPINTDNGWRAINAQMSQKKYGHILNITEFKIGDVILGDNGENTKVETISVKEVDPNTQVYNFELDGDHLYFVNNFSVHNKGPMGNTNTEQRNIMQFAQSRVDLGLMDPATARRIVWDNDNQLRSGAGMQAQLNAGIGGRQQAAPESEPEERDTSALQAEIAALTAGAQQRGADRMAAMYANLGWGTPPPQFGSATEGGDQFFTEQVTADQVPAYAALLNDPSVIQALGSSNQAAPTNRPDLRTVVQERAEQIRTAAKGGMINRYDLGGLVNNMLLQAGRSRDNIPSNAVS